MGHFSGRRTCASVVAAFLLAAPLAACAAGGSTPGGLARATGPGPATVAAFDARARQVVARWDGSPLARAWQAGLVLTDPAELTAIPANSGFTSQHQKDALAAGRFVLDGTLPSGRLTGTVTWAGGTSPLTVPLLGARATFRRLAASQPCVNGPCGHFTVTGARPGSLTVLTNRGEATIPAWTFIVNGPPYQVTEAALAPGGYSSLPPYVPQILRGNFDGAGLAAISPDGRVLTVTFAGGGCGTWTGGGLVYQTATAVAIGSWGMAGKAGGACAAVGVINRATVRLASPLGTRPVLDVRSGEPVPPTSQVRVTTNS
jgi:hypothetical protein